MCALVTTVEALCLLGFRSSLLPWAAVLVLSWPRKVPSGERQHRGTIGTICWDCRYRVNCSLALSLQRLPLPYFTTLRFSWLLPLAV